MKKVKRHIINAPAKVKDTIKSFRLSAKMVRRIEKWVKEVMSP